jgi:hypothetical protein
MSNDHIPQSNLNKTLETIKSLKERLEAIHNPMLFEVSNTLLKGIDEAIELLKLEHPELAETLTLFNLK